MKKILIRNGRIEIIKDRIYTVSQYQRSVYGEKVIKRKDTFLRSWEPKKSKMAAAIGNGLKKLPIGEDTETLYLGASSGTTVSHISDLSPDGKIFAIEVAPEPFAKLLDLSEERNNIYPVLDSARLPEKYDFFLGHSPDIIYQDISQKDQTDILLRNMDAFPEWSYAFFMLKAISIDSSRRPEDVLNEQIEKLRRRKGIRIIETINISNYHRGHYCLLLQNME